MRRSTDEFVAYFQHMPWVAIPVGNIKKLAGILSQKVKR